MSTSSEPTVSMAVDPRLHYEMFKRWMEEEASTKCTHIYPEGGLNQLNVTDTPAQYAARNLVVVDADGHDHPRPRPEMPTKPVDPMHNAPNATVTLFKIVTDYHRDVALAMTDL